MKISLKLANGATLEFEGELADFERVQEFLSEPPESLTAEAPRGGAPILGPEDDELPAPAVEPSVVAAHLERVGAANDQERMAVMAQLAVDSGQDGIDFDTLRRLYVELGLRRPAQFPSKTLANAKAAGLMVPLRPGLWRTTYRGENFAKGHGRGRVGSSRPRVSGDNGGGEPD